MPANLETDVLIAYDSAAYRVMSAPLRGLYVVWRTCRDGVVRR